MPEFAIGPFTFGDSFWQAIYALGILALFGLLGGVAYFLLHRAAGGVTRRLRNQLGQRLVGVVTGPILLLVFVQGLFLASTTLSVLDPWREQLRTLWAVIVIALGGVATARFISEFLTWYSRYLAPRRKTSSFAKLTTPFRRFSVLLVYLLAGMLILDQLSISISPLIAGLGIGGLAVALALQPTLSNFFAGTYLASDNVITPGDFIQLENGMTGYVVEVGWRSTRLRTPFNNLVVIPNSRLSDSILTNYHGPNMELGVLVEAGVSYSSDLDHVERVSLEVAAGVVEELPEAVSSFAPWFGYERFGDSNIDLWIWVQATDRGGSFKLKTEIMKRLHKRFKDEGIEINYPVRRLVFPTSNGVPPVMEYQELKTTGTKAKKETRQPPAKKDGRNAAKPPV